MLRWPRGSLLSLAAISGILGGCSQGGLAPRGPEAARISGVFWALVAAAGLVSLVVLGAWLWGVLRPAGRGSADHERTGDDEPEESSLVRRFLIGGGIVMPAVVLAVFFGVQIATTVAQPSDGEVVIEVTGHQYWWEVRYEGLPGIEAFSTANQIHIPVGTQVAMVLRSEDVIHSFWVPQLAGKLDLVPGREERLVLSADEPGVYSGYCAEYCGLQHTWMKFDVVAMEPGEFRAWAEQNAAPAATPQRPLAARGRDVFTGGSCAGCHTIRGVAEEGEIAPDLTHLAGRNEIGAGILPLNEGSLTEFIVNAQAVKPGVDMPPQQLSQDELDALVAYLMSLE